MTLCQSGYRNKNKWWFWCWAGSRFFCILPTDGADVQVLSNSAANDAARGLKLPLKPCLRASSVSTQRGVCSHLKADYTCGFGTFQPDAWCTLGGQNIMPATAPTPHCLFQVSLCGGTAEVKLQNFITSILCITVNQFTMVQVNRTNLM